MPCMTILPVTSDTRYGLADGPQTSESVDSGWEERGRKGFGTVRGGRELLTNIASVDLKILNGGHRSLDMQFRSPRVGEVLAVWAGLNRWNGSRLQVEGEDQKTYIDPDNDIQLPVYSRHEKRSSKPIRLRTGKASRCRHRCHEECSSLPGLIRSSPCTDLRAAERRPSSSLAPSSPQLLVSAVSHGNTAFRLIALLNQLPLPLLPFARRRATSRSTRFPSRPSIERASPPFFDLNPSVDLSTQGRTPHPRFLRRTPRRMSRLRGASRRKCRLNGRHDWLLDFSIVSGNVGHLVVIGLLFDIGGGFFVSEFALALLLCCGEEKARFDGGTGEVRWGRCGGIVEIGM